MVRAQAPITLNGASQFNEEHVFTRAMKHFAEKVVQYYGRPVNFVWHLNSSLGLEKQYFEYMSAGRAVDFQEVFRVAGQVSGELRGFKDRRTRGDHSGTCFRREKAQADILSVEPRTTPRRMRAVLSHAGADTDLAASSASAGVW